MPAGLFQSKWTATGWTILIFLLMVMPPGNIPNQGLFGIPHLDKLVHFILFAGFVWLWHNALLKSNGQLEISRILFPVFLTASFYGIAMEFVQAIFTSRSFDILDIAADIAGAGFALIFIKRRGKK
jgi:VanZ family protein